MTNMIERSYLLGIALNYLHSFTFVYYKCCTVTINYDLQYVRKEFCKFVQIEKNSCYERFSFYFASVFFFCLMWILKLSFPLLNKQWNQCQWNFVPYFIFFSLIKSWALEIIDFWIIISVFIANQFSWSHITSPLLWKWNKSAYVRQSLWFLKSFRYFQK